MSLHLSVCLCLLFVSLSSLSVCALVGFFFSQLQTGILGKRDSRACAHYARAPWRTLSAHKVCSLRIVGMVCLVNFLKERDMVLCLQTFLFVVGTLCVLHETARGSSQSVMHLDVQGCTDDSEELPFNNARTGRVIWYVLPFANVML